MISRAKAIICKKKNRKADESMLSKIFQNYSFLHFIWVHKIRTVWLVSKHRQGEIAVP